MAAPFLIPAFTMAARGAMAAVPAIGRGLTSIFSKNITIGGMAAMGTATYMGPSALAALDNATGNRASKWILDSADAEGFQGAVGGAMLAIAEGYLSLQEWKDIQIAQTISGPAVQKLEENGELDPNDPNYEMHKNLVHATALAATGSPLRAVLSLDENTDITSSELISAYRDARNENPDATQKELVEASYRTLRADMDAEAAQTAEAGQTHTASATPTAGAEEEAKASSAAMFTAASANEGGQTGTDSESDNEPGMRERLLQQFEDMNGLDSNMMGAGMGALSALVAGGATFAILSQIPILEKLAGVIAIGVAAFAAMNTGSLMNAFDNATKPEAQAPETQTPEANVAANTPQTTPASRPLDLAPGMS